MKLGTGQVSREGYERIARELEDKRGELEKRRVDPELQAARQ